jgi:hypothetical protein
MKQKRKKSKIAHFFSILNDFVVVVVVGLQVIK